jgi:hypothetical protein
MTAASGPSNRRRDLDQRARLDGINTAPEPAAVPTPLLLPALFFAGRYALSGAVTRLVTRRLWTQRYAAVRAVNTILFSTLIDVSVNVSVLLAAVYGLRGHLPAQQLVLVVCSVYAASVLHAGVKLVLNAYWIGDLSRYLLLHGLRGPKAWLRAHVASEVHAHFRQMGLLKRLAYVLSGAPRCDELIELLTREIWKVVATKLFAIVVIVLVYVAVFSLHTRPVLIADATRLNWLQAFLWPFAYAVDYFLPTRLAAWIEGALRF